MAKFSTFLYHSGTLYGATMSLDAISPETGPSTGGTPFILIGTAFDFSSFDDYFTNAILDISKWTDISTGTGSVTTGASHLVLSSGATSGSVAGIEMDYAVRDCQFEMRVNIPPVVANPTATVNLITFSKYIDANNYANLSIKCSSTGSITLDSELYRGGVLIDSVSTEWTSGISTLKILQWQGNIYFYANGSLVYSSKGFVSTSGKYRAFVYNGSASYNAYGTIVEYVLCRPYVVFGEQVVHDSIYVSDTRIRGLTPPSIDYKDNLTGYAGLVDVSVVSSATITATNFFEYYFVDRLTMVDNSQFDLKISDVTDNTIRTPGLYNKGLGDGK